MAREIFSNLITSRSVSQRLIVQALTVDIFSALKRTLPPSNRVLSPPPYCDLLICKMLSFSIRTQRTYIWTYTSVYIGFIYTYCNAYKCQSLYRILTCRGKFCRVTIFYDSCNKGQNVGPLLFSIFIDDIQNAHNDDMKDTKIFEAINTNLRCYWSLGRRHPVRMLLQWKSHGSRLNQVLPEQVHSQ